MNMEYYSPDVEDSAFYANLTRQILMIMDDEDETNARRSIKGESGLRKGSVVGRGSGGGGLAPAGGYFSWSESGRGVEVPGWMERLWASNGGGGTGVFIPRVVVAAAGKTRRRRRNKARKNAVNNGGIRIHA